MRRFRDMSWCLPVLLIAGLILGGCGSSGGGTGTLSLDLVDSSLPGIAAVYVTVDHVDVNPQGGTWQTVLTPQKTVNLLDLINGVQQPLGLTDLAAGRYTQMRLVLGAVPDAGTNLLGDPHPFANYLIDDGDAVHELKVPSGLQSGIKLSGFTIANAATTELVLDFDAARSVVLAGSSGQYLLKPTISVVSSAATVSGRVTDQALVPLAGTQVSAQTTVTATPLVVASTLTFGDGDYRLFLEAGDYQLVAFRPGTNGSAWMPGCRVLNLAANTHLGGQDFTLAEVTPGTLNLSVNFSGDPDQHVLLSLRQAAPSPCTQPLELATYQLADGASLALELPAGDYTLVAALEGVGTQSFDLSVTAGASTDQAISF